MGDYVKVAIFGARGVGKTSLVWAQLVGPSTPTEYDAQVDENHRSHGELDGEPFGVEILDTHLTTAAEWTLHGDIARARAVLLVYAVNSRESFDALPQIKDDIVQVRTASDHDEIAITIVVANKIDLQQERVVSTQEGEDLAQAWGAKYYETSCCGFEGIPYVSVVQHAIRDIRRYLPPPAPTSSTTSNSNKEKGCVIQ